jgi:PAS domain S-box-containing protein
MAYDVTERETELKDLWDNAPVGYHSLDPEGNIIRINQTELNWLGYKAEELVNKAHVTKIMTPESQETFKRNFTIFKERGWIKDVEFEFLKKDGTRVPVLVSATAVFNPDGTYHHARSTVVDDTFLRAARVDREQKYRMLMENSFDVIFLLNMDLRYTYVSPAVEKLRGYSVAEVMNQTMDQVMTPESAQAAYLAFVEQMKILEENPSARPEPGMVDVELLCKDGSTVWTEIKSGFIYGTDGRPVGVMGIIRDISERRQMTNELINARDRAEVSEKLKSAFLANMSHEIRTPLNAIVGFSSLLDETDSPSERKQFVELINHGSDQLLQILDDILDISRIEAKQLNVRPELVNLPEIFSNLEKQSLIALSSKKPGSINLKCSIIKENLPETIFVDPIRLVRVMNNLIDNAIKFTGQGEIVFGYQPCGNPRFIRFFVKDTGIGIRKDQLDVIFERFRQGENSLSRPRARHIPQHGGTYGWNPSGGIRRGNGFGILVHTPRVNI